MSPPAELPFSKLAGVGVGGCNWEEEAGLCDAGDMKRWGGGVWTRASGCTWWAIKGEACGLAAFKLDEHKDLWRQG